MRGNAVTTFEQFNKQSLSFALLRPGDYARTFGSTPPFGRPQLEFSSPEVDDPSGSVGPAGPLQRGFWSTHAMRREDLTGRILPMTYSLFASFD